MQQKIGKNFSVSEITASEFVKLSLLTKRYFSSVAIVLASSPKILHVNKKDFFEKNFVVSDQ